MGLATEPLKEGHDITETWASEESLKYHLDQNAGEWNLEDHDLKGMAEIGYNFLQRADYDLSIAVLVDSAGGVRLYDAKTNTFGSYTPDGKTITIYHPTAARAYWAAQVYLIRVPAGSS